MSGRCCWVNIGRSSRWSAIGHRMLRKQVPKGMVIQRFMATDDALPRKKDPLRELILEKERAFKQLKESEAEEEEEKRNKQKKLQEVSKQQPMLAMPTIGAKEYGELMEQSKKIQDQQSKLLKEMEKYTIALDMPNQTLSSPSSQDISQQLSYYLQSKPLEMYQEYSKFSKKYYQEQITVLNQYLSEKKHLAYENLGLLSKLINDITGYTEVNKIKQNIDALEIQVGQAQKSVKLQKQNYTDVVERRTQTQKDINELLTRKHEWTPNDLESFTELYREDHSSDKLVSEAANALEQSEIDLEATRSKLLKEISNKYHEEYLWNNKMKSLSTWVTLGLMVLNIVILILTQIFFEPLKIERIMSRFEHRLVDNPLIKLERNLQQLDESLKRLESNQGQLMEKLNAPAEKVIAVIEQTKDEPQIADKLDKTPEPEIISNNTNFIRKIRESINIDIKAWKACVANVYHNFKLSSFKPSMLQMPKIPTIPSSFNLGLEQQDYVAIATVTMSITLLAGYLINSFGF
ncbi:She9 protein [Saccharomycopsis crataegensis]|uniref:Sensitive to high expression protein 9, mitochondrial n=1 Tax=Saccharomycopsis crataegensis TaxID=43959 RepID=A0AAV5QFX3_9ASCO|nr:She9 protein [Saccharomycopsis crataegensis]